MNQYLLDTNILLRAADTSSATHSLSNNAINQIIIDRNECVITSQVLIEFWVVATRPTDVNGLGWSISQTEYHVNDLLNNFTLLPETPDIFTNWLKLVTDHDIKGKRTHDIRLLAVMKAHDITHLLTFNPQDFIQIPEIKIVHPQEIVATTN
jgi:predicted nucleic acid-binding protein